MHAVQQTAPDLAKMMKVVTKKKDLEELRVPTAVGAVVTDTAARMWPYKLVARILEDLLKSTELHGTFNLQTLTPVECFVPYDQQGRWYVKTPRGSVIASKVVLATNGYTSHLLPNFADLIVSCRGQMSALEPLPSVAGEKRLKTSFGFMGDGIDDYLIQRPDARGGHLMFGGGRQYGQSIGITDDSELDTKTAKYLRSRLLEAFELPEGKEKWKNWPDICDRCIEQWVYSGGLRPTFSYHDAEKTQVTCRRRRPHSACEACQQTQQPCSNIAQKEPKAAPAATQFRATHEWTGIMGFSRDEHPWIGPVPDNTNLYIAAGYTGHGMPNTWLCGKAVALMVKKTLDFQTIGLADVASVQEAGDIVDPHSIDKRVFTTGAVFSAVKDVGLPVSYLVTKERMLRAMDLESVEAKDWAEMERARRKAEADRPHSGYA